MKRQALNRAYYQQAGQFAKQFSPTESDEFLAENTARQAFEEVQLTAQAIPNFSAKRPLVWGGIALLSVLLSASVFYWKTERYTLVQQGEQALETFLTQKADEDNNQRNDHYIVNLQNQLRNNPNNGDLWFELGQAYSLSNDFESAMIALNNAMTVLGRKPAIIGAMATADYYRNKQVLSAQAKAWIDEALNRDKNESASLLLLASNAFLHNDFDQAIGYWERVLNSDNESIDRREVIESINIAKQMLQGQRLQTPKKEGK